MSSGGGSVDDSAHDEEGDDESRRAARVRRLERNLGLLGCFRALQMALFPVAIVTLFLTDTIDLTMQDVFVLQGAFGLTTALLEFPGGTISDRIGYRRSLLAACVIAVVGWSIYAGATSFATVLVAQVILAMSLALISGTDAALLYESLLELDREGEFTQWHGRVRSFGAVAEGTAALAAGVLYAWWARLPFLVEIAAWVANGVLAYLLIEPLRPQGEPLRPVARVIAILHYAMVRVPKLRASIVTVVLFGMMGFVPVWIIAVYAKKAGVEEAWIGPMWAVANYAVAIGSSLSGRAERTLGFWWALVGGALVFGVEYAGLGFSTATFGFTFYYAICSARGVVQPILNHLQQRLIPSSDRATLLSLNSLTFRALFASLSGLIGAALDREGEHTVLLVAGSILVPLVLISLAWLRVSRQVEIPRAIAPARPSRRDGSPPSPASPEE